MVRNEYFESQPRPELFEGGFVMLKKWPIVLIAAAAAACTGKAGNNVSANQANGAAANSAASAGSANSSAASNSANSSSAASAPYDARGTEPFWGLAIGGGQMTYTPADGAPISEALPAQVPIANGYSYTGTQLKVVVTHTACSDGMSELSYADTVVVTVGGATRNGCGGATTGGN
jgi:uncharacterized membrane protein